MPLPTETERLAPDAPDEAFALGLRYEQAGLADRAALTYERVLDGLAAGDRVERAEAHLRLARVHRARAAWAEALDAARTAAIAGDAAGLDDLVGEAINVEVGVHILRGDLTRAEELARTALARVRDPRVRGILLQNQGAAAAQRGAFAEATTLFAEAVAAFRAAGYDLGLAFALNSTSAAARDAGDPVAALARAREARRLARRLEALDQEILAIQNEAHALVDLGQLSEAETRVGEALGHFVAVGDDVRQAECLAIMGDLSAKQPEYAAEATLCFQRARVLADANDLRALSARMTAALSASEHGQEHG